MQEKHCRIILVFLAVILFRTPFAFAELTEVPVHFAVISGRDVVTQKATEGALKNEIKILNQYFVTEDRRQLLNFMFQSAAL